MEPASEGLSLLKLAARLDRGDEMSPASLRLRWCVMFAVGGGGGELVARVFFYFLFLLFILFLLGGCCEPAEHVGGELRIARAAE
jgi:hypothetical protein